MQEPPTRSPWQAPLLIGIALVAVAFALGLWIESRGNSALGVDHAWNGYLAGLQAPPVTDFAYGLNWLGGGWFAVIVLPVAGAVILLVLRRPWAAGFFVAASTVSAILIQVLKNLFDRTRPEDISVLTDHGSFPSGHVANAATIATVAVVIIARWWVAFIGALWVLLMAFSRTYLHAHWLSDTFGGALAGAGTALLVGAAFTIPLTRARPVEESRRIPLE